MTSSSICSNCGLDGLASFIIGIPSSPVPELLKCNQPPSLSEATLTHTSIMYIDPYLQRLEEEVVRVRCILDDLRRCRDALRSYRYSHKGVLSSIRKLPPEILGSIFLETLPTVSGVEDEYASYDAGRMSSGLQYRDAVSNLVQVCKRWKDVSVSTPQLWSRICMHRIFSETTDKVDTWLQRSAETPLSVVCPNVSDILPSLLANMHRWEEANLRSDKVGLKKFTASTHHLPLLRTLSIEVVDSFTGDYGFDDEQWSIGIDAPTLHNFALHVLNAEIQIPSMKIPFSQLTVISLDFPSLTTHQQSFLDIISLSRNIFKCSLRYGSFREQPPTSSLSHSLISLPNLQHLDIHGEWPSTIIQHLVTPALRNFKCFSAWETWPFESFTSLIARSRCTIVTLGMRSVARSRIMDARIMDEEFMELLRVIPDLESLDVSDHSNELFSEIVMYALNHNTSPPIYLVPRLKHLKLNVPNALPEIEILVDLIESRFGPESYNIFPPGYGSELETVTLIQYHGPRAPATGFEHSTRLRAGRRLASLEANGKRLIAKSYNRDIPVAGIFLSDT